MVYEMQRASAGNETKAFIATLEPILMSASKQMHTASAMSAFIGIFSFGWTFTKTAENGKPLSREKAQMSRETEAKMLKKETKMLNMSIEIKTFVAAFESVAW